MANELTQVERPVSDRKWIFGLSLFMRMAVQEVLSQVPRPPWPLPFDPETFPTYASKEGPSAPRLHP